MTTIRLPADFKLFPNTQVLQLVDGIFFVLPDKKVHFYPLTEYIFGEDDDIFWDFSANKTAH